MTLKGKVLSVIGLNEVSFGNKTLDELSYGMAIGGLVCVTASLALRSLGRYYYPACSKEQEMVLSETIDVFCEKCIENGIDYKINK